MPDEKLIGIPKDLLPFPATVSGNQLIIANDVIPAAVCAPLKNYANAISGSFTFEKKPCSILVAWGNAIREEACHAHIWKPESVLYRRISGRFGIGRFSNARELPEDVVWAIGGLGITPDFDPEIEGFTGKYTDVLRKTDHTFVGVKGSVCVLGFVHDETVEGVRDYIGRLHLDFAVMLDGGSVAAINCVDHIINAERKQYYIIQAV
jgi:hypothetical protein